MNKEQIDALAMKVANEYDPEGIYLPYESANVGFANALIAEYEKEIGWEPMVKRFNCWSTNEGDSWYDHPADAQLLEDVLGNEPKIGDEFEVMAGWHCVQAKYKIVSQNRDDFEVECLSHPFDTAPARPDPRVAELEKVIEIERSIRGHADAAVKIAELEAQNAILQEQFTFELDKVGSRNYELRMQNAALLVALEEKTNALSVASRVIEPFKDSATYKIVQDAMWLNPSTELLEARDRKLDAKLLRAFSKNIGANGGTTDRLNYYAVARESGEWKPELGD